MANSYYFTDMTQATFAPPAFSLQKPQGHINKTDRVVVVGAGAFGGWTALHLLQKGLQVTLVDSWGPGNARSSSGDETRVIRSTYGNNAFYFNLNVRALALWTEYQSRWGRQLFHNTGVLWLCYEDRTPFIHDSLPFAAAHHMPYQQLSVAEVNDRYPLVNTADLRHAYLDPFGGYLMARESCRAVADAFVAAGGTLLHAEVAACKFEHSRITSVLLADGSKLLGDAFVFACGAWLPQLFPDWLAPKITCTRQEVYYFGVPAAHARAYDQLLAWVDVDGENFYYGIPGNQFRGFKIGVDKRGAAFDPSRDNRLPAPDVLARARAFMAHRFPGLAAAPLIESRVCPYENSADGNFIFEQHPEATNGWCLGGGSGHGFKHGPALGELVTGMLVGSA
jgi:glycine/D-amino acid oxidase-like deaminating enzyme